MLTTKWKGSFGLPLVAVAALALAACNDTSTQPGGTTDDTVGQTVPGQAVPGQPTTQGSGVAEVDRDVNDGATNDVSDNDIADREINPLDRPYELAGRSIETEQGEPLGQITKLVTDDVRNVYAVIEMDDTQAGANGTMMVDIDSIDQTDEGLVLMSQKADLKPYEPENYKPLGAQTPPPQGQTVQ